jgi:glycosyltransferase involved in cell wall biosynthesis
VFNEVRRITDGLEVLKTSIERGELGGTSIEVLVIDDGSTDDTADLAVRLIAPLPHSAVIRLPTNRGKGAAIRAGINQARGKLVAFMDVDMAVHPSQLVMLLNALGESDVSIGSRSLPGSATEGDTFHRVVMGRTFARIVKLLFDLPYCDTQCGFKAYRISAARLLFNDTAIDRFAFDVDVLARAQRMGLRVTEVPVRWVQVRGSRIRPVADSVSMMADLFRIRRRRHDRLSVDPIALGNCRDTKSTPDGARSITEANRSSGQVE